MNLDASQLVLPIAVVASVLVTVLPAAFWLGTKFARLEARVDIAEKEIERTRNHIHDVNNRVTEILMKSDQ